MIPVNNILRSVYRCNETEDKLNILTMCRNTEKYISLLCQTSNNFYTVNNHPWNNLIEEKPSNVNTLSLCSQPLDCIICYDRAEQYEEAVQLAYTFHIPIVLVDSCSEPLIRSHHWLEQLSPHDPSRMYRKPTLRICNSSHIQNSWNKDSLSIVIPIGIDTDKFKPVQKHGVAITLDNNIPPQLGAEISKRIGNSYPLLPSDQEDKSYVVASKTRYFINTDKTVTIKMLEAMACENIVIAMKNPDTESFIEHSKTGILIESIDELFPAIQFLETSNNLRAQISKSARQKIIDDHSLSTFIQKWSSALNMVKSNFYTPSM